MVQVGEIYQDYKIVEKTTYKNHQQCFIVECMVCGHRKEIANRNILKQDMSHSNLNCKIDYYRHMIGTNIGDYKVLEVVEQEEGYPLAKLECQVCGNVKIIEANKLNIRQYNHDGVSCGDKFWNWFVGKQFGDLLVLSIDHTEKWKAITEYYYNVECVKCHTKGIRSSTALRKRTFYHGRECYKMLDGPYKKEILSRFSDIKQRCSNPNYDKYSLYGGRGIKCEYQYAIDFYIDFIEEFSEYAKTHQLADCTFDRIDVDGNYSKDNLRVTNRRVQNTNRRGKVYFIAEKDGERVICDNTMVFGEIYHINGRSLGNVVRGDSKTAGGWRIIAKSENLDDLKDISVTTNLIIS